MNNSKFVWWYLGHVYLLVSLYGAARIGDGQESIILLLILLAWPLLRLVVEKRALAARSGTGYGRRHDDDGI